MEDVKRMSVRNIRRRSAALACVALLGVTAAACGSGSKPGTHNNSPAATTPAGPTTTPAATSPQNGGAGF